MLNMVVYRDEISTLYTVQPFINVEMYKQYVASRRSETDKHSTGESYFQYDIHKIMSVRSSKLAEELTVLTGSNTANIFC